jgi:hypothetical protein
VRHWGVSGVRGVSGVGVRCVNRGRCGGGGSGRGGGGGGGGDYKFSKNKKLYFLNECHFNDFHTLQFYSLYKKKYYFYSFIHFLNPI